jgi:ABC-2 type transport system permease protein
LPCWPSSLPCCLAAELLSAAAAIALAHYLDVSTADWFTADGLHHLAGDYVNAVLTATVFGTVGISLGVFCRSTPIALGIGLAWLGPLAHIVQLSWSGAARWFPGLVFDAVASGGTAITTYQRTIVTAITYAALALTAAAASFIRRDVSI